MVPSSLVVMVVAIIVMIVVASLVLVIVVIGVVVASPVATVISSLKLCQKKVRKKGSVGTIGPLEEECLLTVCEDWYLSCPLVL